ncbi:hypothetical protein E2C01_058145 [Portunus trituberculatus]|uniref:Uncharacterized protein n=1 Tax=Portunus trituberculatus TaxID=210409 RepID=A0A5B7H2Y8_PORTR|nr:hypothetical protein [Portunus trituberculatus]
MVYMVLNANTTLREARGFDACEEVRRETIPILALKVIGKWSAPYGQVMLPVVWLRAKGEGMAQAAGLAFSGQQRRI